MSLEAHYEQVLSFMELSGEDSIEEANRYMALFDYNLEAAIAARSGSTSNMHGSLTGKLPPTMLGGAQFIRKADIPEPDDREACARELQRYLQFRAKRMATNSPTLLQMGFGFVSVLYKCLLYSVRYFLPSFVEGFLFHSETLRNYQRSVGRRVRINSAENTTELLARTQGASNRMVIAVAAYSSAPHQSIVQLLSRPQFQRVFAQFFDIIIIEGENPPPVIASCIRGPAQLVFLRQNAFGETIVLASATTQDCQSITANHLAEVQREAHRQFIGDRNLIVRFQNQLEHRAGSMRRYLEVEDDEEETAQEWQSLLRQPRTQVPTPVVQRQVSQQISQQKEEFERVKKEHEKAEAQKQQALRLRQQRVEMLQALRQSVEPEPTQPPFVTLVFRCPNGDKVQRKFNSEALIQDLYTWVLTNENIRFESQQQQARDFQLLASYPPESLVNKRSTKLAEAFPEGLEQIIIHEN